MRFHLLVSRLAVIAFVLVSARPAAGQVAAFDADFDDRSMRVDYFHTGSSTDEILSLDRIVSDGSWAGSRVQLIDDTNMGKYLFEVRDLSTDRLLFSRGFASIYGEWETTGRGRSDAPDVSRVASLPLAAQAGADRAAGAGWTELVRGDLGYGDTARLALRIRRRQGPRRYRIPGAGQWSAGGEGRPRPRRGGLHRSGCGEVSRRRQPVDRRAVLNRTLPQPQGGLQRPRGPRSQRRDPASIGRTWESIGVPPCRPSTTYSIPNAISSPSTIELCAKRCPGSRTNSSRSW